MTLYLEIEHLRKDINFCLPLEIWAKSKRQMQSKTSWSCEHALKTASKKRNSKRTAEATDDLISNKIAEKNASWQNTSERVPVKQKIKSLMLQYQKNDTFYLFKSLLTVGLQK